MPFRFVYFMVILLSSSSSLLCAIVDGSHGCWRDLVGDDTTTTNSVQQYIEKCAIDSKMPVDKVANVKECGELRRRRRHCPQTVSPAKIDAGIEKRSVECNTADTSSGDVAKYNLYNDQEHVSLLTSVVVVLSLVAITVTLFIMYMSGSFCCCPRRGA